MVAGLGQRGSAQECFPAVANIWPSRDVRGQHLNRGKKRALLSSASPRCRGNRFLSLTCATLYGLWCVSVFVQTAHQNVCVRREKLRGTWRRTLNIIISTQSLSCVKNTPVLLLKLTEVC